MELEPQENTSSGKVGNVVLVILVLVAVVLAYFLYQKLTSDLAYAPQYTETQDTTPQGSGPANADISGSFDFPALSADERAALAPPSDDATEEEQRTHFTLVQKIAVDTGELAIGADCKVSPVVLGTQLGEILVFKNYDSTPHTITFNQDISFNVPARKSMTVPANFGKGAGVYGYGCDQNTSAAGMMLVGE